MKEMLGTALNDAQLTSGIHDSKHASVMRAYILNTSCKLISKDKQEISIPRGRSL